MKLGYHHGYQVPKCPKCGKYMHKSIGSTSNLCWTFKCCDTYWEVTYIKDGKKYVIDTDDV